MNEAVGKQSGIDGGPVSGGPVRRRVLAIDDGLRRVLAL